MAKIATNVCTIKSFYSDILCKNNFLAQRFKVQDEPLDCGIMAGTVNINDDEDDSDYMGESGEGTDSADDDISLEDEKDMELVCETAG